MLLHRTTFLLDKAAERVLQEELHITLSQFFVLMQLAEERLCQRELATALGVTPAAVSRHVAQLTDLGYVSREANESDRRFGYVTITPVGHEAYGRARGVLKCFFAERYATVSTSEQAAIKQALQRLMGCFEDCGNTD